MIAFSSIIEGPSKSKVESMIQVALEKIVALIADKHDRVKLTASTTLNRIAEVYPLSILNHANFPKFSQILINSINAKPKVNKLKTSFVKLFFLRFQEIFVGFLVFLQMLSLLWTLLIVRTQNYLYHNINLFVFDKDHISQIADLVLQNLFKNILRTDIGQGDLYVIDISFMALINFLHYINNPQLASKYLFIFIDQFKNTYSMSSLIRNNIQNGLFSAIHVKNKNLIFFHFQKFIQIFY